jgi:hypothetical protein
MDKLTVLLFGLVLKATCLHGISISPIPASTIDSLDTTNNQQLCEEDWHLLLEEMTDNGMVGAAWEERLTELANHPVSLNGASKEELESIPFLNADMVENLSYYLYRYGPMVNLSELLLVDGMDAQTLRWLKPFVRIEKASTSPVAIPDMHKALAYGKHSLRLTTGSTIQSKSGFDRKLADSLRYAGDPIHACLRYGFDYKGLLQWGIVLEKDPGEKWWNPKQQGVDYSSFHFVAKDAKHRNLCFLGDYNVRFGQGLVCGSAFSLGKNTSGLSPEMTGSNVSRHFSSSEIAFFRGVALQLSLKSFQSDHPKPLGLDLISFFSRNQLDANVENGIFTTVYETGLHRNVDERDRQNRLKQTVFGSHLALRGLNIACGITLLTWIRDGDFVGSEQPWNVFKTNRNKGGNLSVDFRFVLNRFLIYGEMALDQTGKDAWLTGVTFKPYPRMSLSMLVRKYDPAYLALFANAFSEGTSTSNEEGLYASSEVQLAKRLRLTGYLDVFRFPWLNYGVNAPSWGHDLAVELSSTIGRNGIIKWMLKSKMKEKNRTDSAFPISPITSGTKTQMRLQIQQRLGAFSLKAQCHYTNYQEGIRSSHGFALAQDLGFDPETSGFSMVAHAVLFQTESWENRIYLWEKALPGTFSMPMLYGKGGRIALCTKYESEKWAIQIKFSDTVFPNQKSIGVGQERIQGNRRTEVGAQLNWKF